MDTKRAKTARGSRALKEHAPKIVENPKNAMILRGSKTSSLISSLLQDLLLIKKPEAVSLHKRLDRRPFEDDSSIEFLSEKNDCSIFAYGSHTKKRPHSLVLGRLFDYHMLDMMELAVKNFKGLLEFKNDKFAIGSKPCMLFQGQEFNTDPELVNLKSLLLDWFRGPEVSSVNLAGLDHILVFTVSSEKVLFRHYRLVFLKSGGELPHVEMDEIGPSFDLYVRRSWHAAEDVQKLAMQKPKKAKTKKNVSEFEAGGEKLGKVHMQKQDFSKIHMKKSKALKKVRPK